ncbi:LemA family protein [Pseudomonas sp. H3(2019)]|uniref:LemA family protein n=1 Tax=Pseudomonas sp. H3(2019) TaxID=2598724 RepID=UPI0011913B85|nr:LemA family protein [Pseudomonas sp. H3(2019)]TVT81005.1 LemA family protein [Pseudomonas sp. H3(2019)]
MGLLLIFAVLIGITFWICYNRIIGRHNRAQRAWADVLVYERQKTRVLDQLELQVAGFKTYEGALLEKITGLRSAIGKLPQEANGDALQSVQKGTRELLAGLSVAFEAYPELKANELVGNFMREITEQQENVGAAITLFNGAVEIFNNSIQMFPSSLVNGCLNKKNAIIPFSDAEASAVFEYKPNF